MEEKERGRERQRGNIEGHEEEREEKAKDGKRVDKNERRQRNVDRERGEVSKGRDNKIM